MGEESGPEPASTLVTHLLTAPGALGQPGPGVGVKCSSVLSHLKQEPLWLLAGFSGGSTAIADAWEFNGPGDCH